MKILLLNCLLLSGFSLAGAGSFHPFHVSTSEITYNAKEQKLEITCSIFIDDLQDVISRLYKVKADLLNKTTHKKMDLLVKHYLMDNLQVDINSKELIINYLGYAQDNDVITVRMESGQLPPFKKIELNNDILLDQYPDEMNIVHIIVGGERRSHRLDYPEHLVAENF